MITKQDIEDELARRQALADPISEGVDATPGGLEISATSREQILGRLVRSKRENEKRVALESAQTAEEESGVVDKAKAGARGLVRGTAQIPPILLSILESLPGGAGGSADVSQAPTPGQLGLDLAEELPGMIGLGDPRPVEDRPVSERLIEFSGEAVPSSVLGEFGALKLAKRTGPSLPTQPLVERKAKALLERSKKSPGGVAFSESASVAGEALGRVSAQESNPGDPLEEGIRAFSGSVGLGLVGGTLRKSLSGTEAIVAGVVPGTRRGARNVRAGVAEELQDESLGTGGTQAASEVDRSIAIQDELGVEFSGAQATRDPNVLQMGRRAAAVTPGLRGELIEKQSKTNQAIFDAVETRAPIGDPEAVRNLARKRGIAIADDLQSEVDAAVVNVQDRALSARGGMTPEVAGEDVVAEVAAESRRAFAPLSARYTELEEQALNSGATARSDLIGDAVAALKRKTSDAEKTAGNLPDGVFDVIERQTTELLDDGSRVRKNISLFELRGLEKSLKAEIRGIRGSLERVNDTKLPALNQLLDAVESTMDDFIENAPDVWRDIADGFRDNNAAYRDLSRRFRGPVTGRTIAKELSPKAESAQADVWFRPGTKGRKSMRQFKIAAAESPESQSLMNSYIIGRAIDETIGPDGLINARRLEKFKRKYRAALTESPRAADEINNVLKLQRTADEAVGRQKRSLAEFDQSSLSLFSKSAPHEAVQRIVKAGNPAQVRAAAKKLVAEMEGDPSAMAGLRRMFWDDVTARSIGRAKELPTGHFTPFVSPGKLRTDIEKFRPAIEEIFGKEHLENLELIAEAAEIAALQGGSGALSKVDQLTSFQRLVSGASFRAIYSRFYSGPVRAIRVGKGVMRVLDNLSQMQQVDLMNEALANPELMKTLLMDSTGALEPLIVRRLRGNLITLGHRIPDEEEDQ